MTSVVKFLILSRAVPVNKVFTFRYISLALIYGTILSMEAFRDSMWLWVAAAILLVSSSVVYADGKAAKPTRLDRLPFLAKVGVVVAMGAAVFTVVLLLNA